MDVDGPIENAPFTLSEEDKIVLRQAHHEFRPHTWGELKMVIAAGDMSTLGRSPLDMRNYLTWFLQTKNRYGTVADYVRQQKLQWQPPILPASKTPFANPDDYKILRNDWPYGMTPDIIHMVVWSKTPIDVVPGEGNPTPESRRLIEAFVEKTFTQEIGPDGENKVMWFKQRAQWQSVGALEHIHVIVRGVDESLVEKWTGQSAQEISSRNYQTLGG
ncbi:MAG: hypothetical protein M1840_000200 [Geoglossum simile]|nr:MAG: hypothetical protein M1840_000200 [Geoglossum simile]